MIGETIFPFLVTFNRISGKAQKEASVEKDAKNSVYFAREEGKEIR